MNKGAGDSFSSRIVVDEQKQLYSYWRNKAQGRGMPSRTDICPKDFVALLPTISLIDVEESPRRYRFRLVGTELWNIYQREITGSFVDELDWSRDEWLTVYSEMTRQKLPVQGTRYAPVPTHDHLVQHWLRLPLSSDGCRVDMILCHDVFLPVNHMGNSDQSRFAA